MSNEDNKNKIVLIVEDDEVLLRALYIIFHNHGYTIATATDGETALKMVERLKPSLIVLDLILPIMDGFRFLEIVKTVKDLKNIPIIVLSNLCSNEDIRRAKSLGADEYFIKADVNFDEIMKKVKEIIL